MIYQAFRKASCWVANDYYKKQPGFSLPYVVTGNLEYGRGCTLAGKLQCKVSTPEWAQVKLYKMGHGGRK
jgi:hypothetical protein